MQRLVPILHWLPRYRKRDFPSDVIAGLTVGIVIIPQGMAYALIAGLPPVYGLYASLFPVLVYAFMGTSRHIAVGPVALDSLLVGMGLGTLAISGIQQYLSMAILLTFLVGAIQFGLGILRMGFLVNFLSRPVISGFTSAAAVIIIFSQVKHLFGINIHSAGQVQTILVNIYQNVRDSNIFDLCMGFGGILILVGLKKLHTRIPSILLVVVLSILIVFLFGLESHGIQIVGDIPAGLPSLQMPDFNLTLMSDLGPVALTLALIGYLEAISIGKGIEEKLNMDTIIPNQELIALGSANMIGSFFQSFPVTAGFSRSAISFKAGTKTNVAGMFTVLLVVVTLLFLTPVFYYMPKAILASIIMVSVVGLIDIPYAKSLWKHRKDEFAVLIITVVITLFMGIIQGMLTGVLISLLLMVYRSSKPHFAILGHIKGTDYFKNVDRFNEEVIIREDLLIVRFDAQLYFGNSSYFKQQLYRFIDEKGPQLKGVILNADAINYIDASGAQMLIKVIRNIHEMGLQFYIAGAIGPTRDIIFSSGIITELHREFLFVQTKDAVDYFDKPYTVSGIRARLAYQNRAKRR